MAISFLGRSIGSVGDRDTAPAATTGETRIKRDSEASPLPLRGLSRFERLRNALPQRGADSLLRCLVSLPSRGSAADAAASPVEQADAGDEFAWDVDSLLGADSRSMLLSRAMHAETGRDEQASRASIETILDMCEAGHVVLDDELAGITFRLIASLEVTPLRDRFLDRALDIVCSDAQLKISPQVPMSDKWVPEEQVYIHARMHDAVMTMPDTPERAVRLGAVIGWISRFEPSDQPAAIKKAWDAIDDTNVANRFVPLTQLRDLAIYLPTGAERGRLLLDLRKLDGDWLRACRTEDDWRWLFPDPETLSPELIGA